MRIPTRAGALVAGMAGLLLVTTPTTDAFCSFPGLKELFGGRGAALADDGSVGAAKKTIFEYTVKDWQGNVVPLSKYQTSGKVAIVVNVASK